MEGEAIRFPAKAGLSASGLKYLACLFMVIDHVDAIFFLMGSVAVPESLLYYLLRILGRISFPLFAFLLSEGCRYTRDYRRYLGRLALFAAISQLPYTLAFGEWSGSVILTFFLAAGAIFFYEKALQRWNSTPLAFIPLLLAVILAEMLRCDYGWLGVAIVFALYLCHGRLKRQLICLAIFIFCLYGIQTLPALLLLAVPTTGIPITTHDLVLQVLLSGAFTLSACLSLVPIAFYNGRRGKGNKYFFYVFYPSHLFILYIIARCVT